MTTLLTLLEGLGHYLGWWARALVAGRRARAPLRPRRLLLLLFGMPLFLLVQAVHTLCLLLDELLFPGYRRMAVQEPLFITGLPRSGTTFLHRTLAVEADRYTTLTTWEALLAPSILQRRLIRALARLDGLLGGPGRRGLTALGRRLGGPLEAIHEVGLNAAEEDYLLLLPAGGCFILLLAFPDAPGLPALGRLDPTMDRSVDRSMTPGRRRRLLRLYRGLVQRHLYVDGGERRLLSKNAAFGGWVEGLRETFPDARFLICIREPGTALSSQISAVSGARALFGTTVDGTAFQRLFLDLFGDTLAHLAATVRGWPPERAAIIDMGDLRRAPATTIATALIQLQIAPSARLCGALAGLPRGQHSHHHHAIEGLALPRQAITDRLLLPYRVLLNAPNRIRSVP